MNDQNATPEPTAPENPDANSRSHLSTGSSDRGVAVIVDRRKVDRGGYETVEIVLRLKGKPARDIWERDPALVRLHY